MTTTKQLPLAMTPEGGEPAFALSGGITRLHPFDGLFLRAEHLERMQDYTRRLADVHGQAGGPGLVHGLTVSLQDGRLTVSPGAGFTPNGRAVAVDEARSFPIAALVEQAVDRNKGQRHGVWIIELVADEWSFGDEEVFGRLCDDPCEGGASTRPYVAEGAILRLRGWAPSALSSYDVNDLRSLVASAWFEEERIDGGSLLATSERDAPDRSRLTSQRWSTGTPAPGGDVIPIGVLLPAKGGAREIDLWTARRDRIDPPPQRTWQWQLGMRPRNVFLAQVLQFQSQVAQRWVSTLSPANLLRTLGFVELPPAGFLPVVRSDGSIEAGIRSLFPEWFDLRFCYARPDTIVHSVEQAQHHDRIRLLQSTPIPSLDILVPVPDDLDPSLDTEHTWVAFHRRRRPFCPADVPPPRTDEVELVGLSIEGDEMWESLVEAVRTVHRPLSGVALGHLRFEAGDTTVEKDDVPSAVNTFVQGSRQVTVLALSWTEEEAALGAARAEALAAQLEGTPEADGFAVAEGTTLAHQTIYVLVRKPEAGPIPLSATGGPTTTRRATAAKKSRPRRTASKRTGSG